MGETLINKEIELTLHVGEEKLHCVSKKLNSNSAWKIFFSLNFCIINDHSKQEQWEKKNRINFVKQTLPIKNYPNFPFLIGCWNIILS